VKILGSAAGGGFPQWNCVCVNCGAVRAGSFHGKARTQTQIAITQDDQSWFLLGASPDLRAQIEATPELHPRAQSGGESPRQSPIAGVVLANADLDHVLGLLLLRELQPLRVHATASVRSILRQDNTMFGMLERVANQASWEDFTPGESFPLVGPAGEDSGLRGRAVSLGTHFPAYVSAARQAELAPRESSLGLLIDSASGKRLAYMPWGVRVRRPAFFRRHILDRRRTHSHAGQRAHGAADGPRPGVVVGGQLEEVGRTAAST